MSPGVPDHLTPYTVHITLAASAGVAAPADLVAGFLEDIGGRCEQAGSSLIGHIKCHVRARDLAFHCNLTSSRSRARCGGDILAALQPRDSLEIDLAVLVYGLSWDTIDGIVRESCVSIGSIMDCEVEVLLSPHAHM
jgi:hypothetical protein